MADWPPTPAADRVSRCVIKGAKNGFSKLSDLLFDIKNHWNIIGPFKIKGGERASKKRTGWGEFIDIS